MAYLDRRGLDIGLFDMAAHQGSSNRRRLADIPRSNWKSSPLHKAGVGELRNFTGIDLGL